MVWWGFVISSRFIGCFHNFYECWVSHNIKGDVHLIKTSCPLFVQILFFGVEFNPLDNETCWKVQMLLFMDMLKHVMLFVRGVKFWAPSTWNIEIYSPSTKRFGVSMATSSIHPSEIWASTSMLFNGRKTSSCHIGQIVPSPMDVLLNTLQL